MKMRVLGSSNIQVSTIGLGAMGMDHAYGPQSDRSEMKQLLKHKDVLIPFLIEEPIN